MISCAPSISVLQAQKMLSEYLLRELANIWKQRLGNKSVFEKVAQIKLKFQHSNTYTIGSKKVLDNCKVIIVIHMYPTGPFSQYK